MLTHAGFQVNAGKFFYWFFDLFLASVSGSSIAFAVSVSFESFAVANQITLYIYIMAMVRRFTFKLSGILFIEIP